MKHLLALLSLLVATLPLLAQRDTFEKREITHNGLKLPYRILLPENFDSKRKYPVVLFLHGAGERGNDNQAQLKHGSAQFLNPEFRKKHPCIVIFPQCPAESYWSSVDVNRSTQPYTLQFDYTKPATPALEAALAILDLPDIRRSTNPRRVYITGLSMGGMGTFEAVYRDPKRFAAALPICGGGDTLHYDKRVRKVSFWVFHGDADAVVGVQQSRDMVARLKKIRVRTLLYREYGGVNHNSWDNAFAEPEYLEWMFSQKR